MTREKSDATRARVLESANSAFAEHGYSEVGLESIAIAAGVTRGAIYNHFRNKRELFAEVVDGVHAGVAARIDEATRTIEDPWESLEIGCGIFIETALDDGARQIMLLDAPVVLGWNEWRGRDHQNSGRLLDDVVGELAAAGLVPVSSAPAISALLSGALNEAALWIAASADRESALAEARTVFARLLDGLRTPRAM